MIKYMDIHVMHYSMSERNTLNRYMAYTDGFLCFSTNHKYPNHMVLYVIPWLFTLLSAFNTTFLSYEKELITLKEVYTLAATEYPVQQKAIEVL